jgi:hypothetical protein
VGGVLQGLGTRSSVVQFFEFDNILFFQNHRTLSYVCKKNNLKSKESSVLILNDEMLPNFIKRKHLRKGEKNKQRDLPC